MTPDPTRSALTIATFPSLREHLLNGDDPAFWTCMLQAVLEDIDARWHASPGTAHQIWVGLSKVLEWLRPNQRRWVLGGGFAAPDAYRHHADAQRRWQVWVTRREGESQWREEGNAEPRVRKRREYAVRVAVPGRTKRHDRAAVAVSWRPAAPWCLDSGTPMAGAWYGFRRLTGGAAWQFQAYEEFGDDRTNALCYPSGPHLPRGRWK